MTIPATTHDEPRTYSNGAEHVPADHMAWSGPLVTADLRFVDGFYSHQSGFLDAPGFLPAGSVGAVVRDSGNRGVVQNLASRTQ